MYALYVCLIDKLLLQRLVGVVNTQLLERVVLKHFETENIQHANKMLFDLCLLSSR
jgi:hypothetical protein